jgi:hypothetical protein
MKTKSKEFSTRSRGIQIGSAVAFTLAGMALAAVLLAAQAPPAAKTPAAAQTKPAETKTAEAKTSAPAPAAGPGLRLTATTENVVGAHDSIRIDLLRVSTDAERDQLPTVWTQALARAAAVAAGRGGAAGGGRGGRGGRGGAGGGAADDDPNQLNDPAPAAGAAARPLTPEGSMVAALEKAPTLGYLWSSSEISGYTVRYAVRLPQPDGGERMILITDRRLGDYNDIWNPVTATTSAKTEGGAADHSPSDASGGASGKYEFSIIELRFNGKGLGEGKISMTDKIAVDNTAKVLALADYASLPVVLKNVERRPLGKS